MSNLEKKLFLVYDNIFYLLLDKCSVFLIYIDWKHNIGIKILENFWSLLSVLIKTMYI